MNGTRLAIRPEMKATSRREPVELGDDHRARHSLLFAAASALASCGRRRQRVGTLAGLDLFELADDFETLGLSETGDGLPLRLKAEAGLALTVGRDAKIGDGGFMRFCPL